MGKSLVIVESPTKAKTIKRYLGKEYEVHATMGHIKDLPKSTLGVDIESGFEPSYKVKPEKRDVVKKLRKLAEEADRIYLASDPDREGEAIAWHISEELKKANGAVGRIIFHEITKKAIDQAIKEPLPLNKSLYDAQKARRVMDRIVGYTMSPLLWKRVKRGLSGGRVQSVAVRLICLRQEEIERFVAQEYWTIDAKLLTPGGEELSARVVDPKEIGNEEESHRVAAAIRDAQKIVVEKIKKQVRQKHPLPPFITSTMQQAASSRLRFSAKKTMMIAQQLYEGLALGDSEVTGLITYMRTDSPTVSGEAIGQARGFIPEAFGKDYLPAKPRQYQAKKTAQQAHEAIRPTDVRHTPERVKAHLTKDQHALYELIWQRFISSQMASAVYDQTSVDISAGGVGLRANGSILRFDGFLKVYGQQDEKDALLPDSLAEGDALALKDLCEKQHFTQPPPRYTEASLIKELEERGIGRPSTYAPIISTIQDRGYVTLEQRAFQPTELGRDVNDLLVKHYPQILDIGFTAKMEDSLDELEDGKTDYVKTMSSFYDTYNREHEQAATEMENLRASHRPSGVTCELCGKELLIKLGKNGYFLGCAGYPECKNTREFTRDENGRILSVASPEPEPTDMTCEKCGSPMVLKKGRFGPFYACSAYPSCTFTKPAVKTETTDKKCDKCGSAMVVKQGRFGPFLACSNYPACKNIQPLPLGLKCPMPGCEGEIQQQRSRKGKMYYSCSNKDCRFISWSKPVAKACPKCSAGFLIKKGKTLICPNPECGHHEDEG
ncbi:MAG TPA: type I DNA topoisomerase [Deltaproteobacteria bacterium]|nr:type I DNA topoisomerase [Deltaproteobacteria bacterium]HOI07317.1 type I DNA topoisomerase [Deltaproteobacteria bacterium]